MSIAQYFSKLALGVNSQGVLSAAKGGTGSTSGGGGGSSPTISGISYTGDDTATLPAGGATITLTGTNFGVGVKVLINNTQPSVLTRVSSTQLTFTAPAMNLGVYPLYVVNSDGSAAILVPGIEYSNTPAWTTASGTLGSVIQQVSFNASVVATGDAPISYSIVSGTLPSGLTLNSSTGAITGTAPSVASSTTYTFTIRSTDAQLQDTDRVFSITVVPSNAPPTIEYLVVAGGGGAGVSSVYYAGGGGAGGFRTATGYVVSTATPITVVVGAGGAVAGGAGGGDSSFGTITSTGGGAGANLNSTTGINGGSGGGSGPSWGSYTNASDFTYGTGITGQGNNGGHYPSLSGNGNWVSGSGGGGAGGMGSTGSSTYTGSSYPYPTVNGAPGGDGLQSSITGTATWYAGGGGGSGVGPGNDTGGNGGQGGGGRGNNGGFGNGGSAGTANTGGGGGAGWAGGSGIVVIRYADTYDAATATTGSPTVTVAGGYRVYKFTSSGSITF